MFFYLLLGPTFCYSWPERSDYRFSLTRPRLRSATGALVTWNSCVCLLCPAPCSLPLQKPVCRLTSRTERAIPAPIRQTWQPYCALSCSFSLCVFTSEHLPPVHCAREETGAKGGESLHCFASYVLPLSCLSHLCSSCLPRPSLALSLKNFSSSALLCQPHPAALCHPTAWNESEECDHLAGLQAIVPGGPCWVLHWVFLEPCLFLFCTH